MTDILRPHKHRPLYHYDDLERWCDDCGLTSEYTLPKSKSKKERPMSVESTTYVRKPFEVEAVEVTTDNVEEVAKWCDGKVLAEGDDENPKQFVKVRVARALNERQTKAYPGDWVLYAGTGYKVYTPKAFAKTFELKS
jgi:hypothetical protein